MTMPQEKWKSKTACKSKKSKWAFKEDQIKTRIGVALVTKVFEKNKTKGEKKQPWSKRRQEIQVKELNKIWGE